MSEDKNQKINKTFESINRQLRYSTLRMRRINNLHREGFSYTEAVAIRNEEEKSPSHVKL